VRQSGRGSFEVFGKICDEICGAVFGEICVEIEGIGSHLVSQTLGIPIELAAIPSTSMGANFLIDPKAFSYHLWQRID